MTERDIFDSDMQEIIRLSFVRARRYMGYPDYLKKAQPGLKIDFVQNPANRISAAEKIKVRENEDGVFEEVK